mmetsp:Transcript_127268/g.366036  ORF Transcript_127268/g.366036 Transcript_127268/m.366036 type:complete len:326 (+) Transcript_127268:842-1819(+)
MPSVGGVEGCLRELGVHAGAGDPERLEQVSLDLDTCRALHQPRADLLFHTHLREKLLLDRDGLELGGDVVASLLDGSSHAQGDHRTHEIEVERPSGNQPVHLQPVGLRDHGRSQGGHCNARDVIFPIQLGRLRAHESVQVRAEHLRAEGKEDLDAQGARSSQGAQLRSAPAPVLLLAKRPIHEGALEEDGCCRFVFAPEDVEAVGGLRFRLGPVDGEERVLQDGQDRLDFFLEAAHHVQSNESRKDLMDEHGLFHAILLLRLHQQIHQVKNGALAEGLLALPQVVDDRLPLAVPALAGPGLRDRQRQGLRDVAAVLAGLDNKCAC